MKKTVVLILIVLLLQACSWQEYFVITNQTNADIVIEYEIEPPPNGFAIFNGQPNIYKLSESGDIEWNETMEANDTDTSILVVKLVLAPNKAVIIGHLSNDNYKKHDQYFINNRHFNLKKINITKENKLTEISQKNFDDYFAKKKGMIILRTK